MTINLVAPRKGTGGAEYRGQGGAEYRGQGHRGAGYRGAGSKGRQGTGYRSISSKHLTTEEYKGLGGLQGTGGQENYRVQGGRTNRGQNTQVGSGEGGGAGDRSQ